MINPFFRTFNDWCEGLDWCKGLDTAIDFSILGDRELLLKISHSQKQIINNLTILDKTGWIPVVAARDVYLWAKKSGRAARVLQERYPGLSGYDLEVWIALNSKFEEEAS